MDPIQSQSNREMEPDSPVKMPGGKRDLSEVRLASHWSPLLSVKNVYFIRTAAAPCRDPRRLDRSTSVQRQRPDLPLADDIEKKVSFSHNAYPDMNPIVKVRAWWTWWPSCRPAASLTPRFSTTLSRSSLFRGVQILQQLVDNYFRKVIIKDFEIDSVERQSSFNFRPP